MQHARWAKHFSIQFWQGDLYPRWLAGVNGGLGAPAFFFYPPLSSYAAALFWPVSSNFDTFGWRTAGLSAFFGLVFSGIAAYLWLRSLMDRESALFGSIVYMVLPYHIAIDLYNRGAIAEFWAFVWLPLILLSTERLIRGERWAFLALTASYALLIFTHLLITLIFSPIPVVAALVLSERGSKIRTAMLTAGALALGMGLAAVFILPAMLDQPKSYITSELAGDYRNWWLFQRTPLLDFRTRILIITLSCVAFTLALFWIYWRSRPPAPVFRKAVFYFGVALASLYFMTQLSAVFWKYVPFLRFLQFPLRFNTILCVATAVIAGLAFRPLIDRRRRVAVYAVALMMVAWMGANTWAASKAYRKWRPIPANTAALYPKWLQFVPEYGTFFPAGVPKTIIDDILALEKFIAAYPPRAVRLEGQSASTGTVSSWRSRRVLLNINATQDARLTVNHFYYPGWNGYIPSLAKQIPIHASVPEGLLEMNVPKGSYPLVLTLERERPEKAGILISSISLLIAIAIGLWTGFAGHVHARSRPELTGAA